MKILIVGLEKLGTEYGGGELYIKNLVYGLRDKGHALTYLYITFTEDSSPLLSKPSFDGLEELKLALPKGWSVDSSLEINIFNEIKKVLSDVNPDIVHAHGFKEYICNAASLANIPCIVTAHHGGIVCPTGALLNADDVICQVPASDDNCLRCCTKAVPGWPLWLPILRKIPLKVRLWAGERIRRLPLILFITPLGILSCSIRNKIKAVSDIGKYTRKVIAPSPAIAKALIRNGIPEQNISILPHGIPLPKCGPLRSDFGNGPMRFLFVGRISYVKGVHIMLEALSTIPSEKYVLQIVGGAVRNIERRYEAELKRKFASVNVVWHGARPYDEIAEHIDWCDVMLHPTICLEIFGLNIAEALAVGRPVIATRCGGAEAQILDGKNGLLIPPNDSKALGDRLLYCINNTHVVKEMAEKSGHVISLDQHINDLEKIYYECRK